MSIHLRKSDVCDDWFVIVDENGNYISDACVEGTSGEMLVLARLPDRLELSTHGIQPLYSMKAMNLGQTALFKMSLFPVLQEC